MTMGASKDAAWARMVDNGGRGGAPYLRRTSRFNLLWYAGGVRRISWKKKLSSLGAFMLISGLAGLLVAGLAIPGAALAGVASTAVYASLTKLPVELETPPQAERTNILLGDDSLLTQLYDENRIIVTLDQIAPIMRTAQVAIEDDRFYDHGPLDFRSLAKAVLTNLGGDGGGGSTLTQQYVKQVLVEQAMQKPTEEERQQALDEAQGRTVERKIREMRYAIALEDKFSKDQILENYLNIAYYGDGAYGVEAAARHYYGVSAADLTLGQASMLAGIVQTPSRNPVDDLSGALERRDVVLDRMLELDLITQDEADAAKAEGFDPAQVHSAQNGCVGVDWTYVQICQYVLNTLNHNPNLGSTPAEVQNNLRRGGYTIRTYIDPTKQQATQDAVSSQIADADPVKSAMVIMEPGTGRVFAAAQNRRQYALGDDNAASLYAGETAIQYFAQYDYGIDEGAQAGSTFKPFVVAAALDAGISPNTTFAATSPMNFTGQDFKGCDGPAKPNGSWTVGNSSISGVMNMYTAAANSVNTYFVQLEKLVGLCNVVTMATKLGAMSWPDDPDHPDIMSFQDVPAFTLGVADTSPMQMAVVYSTFAARGTRCDPVIVKSIQDRDGNEVPTTNGNCQQVIRPEVADGVNRVLSQAFYGGTASGWGVSGHTLSGKTGTTEDGAATWIVGYTPQLVGIAMVSVDNNPAWADFWAAHGKSMEGVLLPSGVRLSGVGASTAGPIWRPAMTVALQDLPNEPFTAPTSDILNGKTVTAPSTEGMSPADARKALEAAGFFVQEASVYDDSPAGSLVSAVCQPMYGGTCTLNISQGPRPSEAVVKPPGGQDTVETGG